MVQAVLMPACVALATVVCKASCMAPKRWPLAVLGLLLNSHPRVHAFDFVLINGAATGFVIKWLPDGVMDKTQGVQVGNLKPHSHQHVNVGSEGHAFRLEKGNQRSRAFAYEGGFKLNVVGVQLAADGTPEVEAMGPTALKAMVVRIHRVCPKENFETCALEHSSFPTFKIAWPSFLVQDLSLELSPRKQVPTLLGKRYAENGRNLMHGDYGAVPPDEFVLMHSLPFKLQLRWFPLVEEPNDGMDVSLVESESVATIPASTSGKTVSIRVSAGVGQMFNVITPKSKGSRQSRSFVYPGELALLSVWEDDTDDNASGSLQAMVLNEDGLKVFLSDTARSCGDLSHDDKLWRECFESNARLPTSNIRVPSDFLHSWFKVLWESLGHWRLCNYQQATAGIENITIKLGTGVGASGATLWGEVLRKDPLVVAVHGLATAEECESMVAFAGYDLGMAVVSGGTTSRGRRTLSKNLVPDLANTSSILTQLTHRFFDVARQATGYELYPEGQEPVNWLYYKPGYEYRPHCDGDCGTPRIRRGARVASSLLYCATAEDGGGTVFPPDKLKLEPTVGMMLLFAYNPDPKGLSYHSACPVLRGEKLTATQWYREGVNAKRNWEKIDKRYEL